MKKRILSILLTLCIVTGIVPTSFFAAAQTADSWSGLQSLINNDNNLSVTLTQDISWGGSSLTIPAGKTVTLDLNGKAVDAQNSGTAFVVNGTLTIKNSGADLAGPIGVGAGPITGNIKNGKAVDQKAGGIFVASGGKLIMNSGWLTNCVDDSSQMSAAGGIYVSENAEFEMNGGIITGCIGSNSPYIPCAAGVVNYGTFTMSGNATVSGSKDKYKNDGIAICNAGIFNANGGTVQTGQTCRNYAEIRNTGKSATVFYCDVLNTGFGTISGGTYSYPLQNAGEITNGTFNGTVENTGVVTGGTFNGTTTGIYTVTFDSGVPSQIRANAPATVPDAPTRKGYTFKYWLKDGTAYDFTQNVTENISLTADWTAKSYTVRFNTDGGSAIGDKVLGWNDTVLSGISAPEKAGYDFKGWTYNGRMVSASTSYSALAADDTVESITLTAQWTAETYGITVADENGDEKEINSVNKGDVFGDGGSVKFEYDKAAKKGTLTLTNATLKSDDTFAINAEKIDILEIVLVGKNELRTSEICIAANDLIFSGTGSAEIVGGFMWGIDCGAGGITVNGGTVTVTGKSAVCVDDTVTVNGGTLTLIATDYYGMAIDAVADPVIAIGSDMTLVTGTESDGSDITVTYETETEKIKAARFVSVAKSHLHCICGGKNGGTEYDGHDSHDNRNWMPWSANDSLPENAGNYYLINDIALTGRNNNLPDGVNVCLNGKRIKGEYSEGTKLNVSGTLGITDCGAAGSIGELSLTGSNAMLTMYGGSIVENATIIIEGETEFTMTGNAQNNGVLRICNNADFTMDGNAKNNNTIKLEETSSECSILFGGHAEGGYVSVEQPQYDAGFRMIGNAKITELAGFYYAISLTMEDNSEIGDVGIGFTSLSLSGKAKLGSAESSYTIGERDFVLKDDVQLIGSVTYDTSDYDCVLTLQDRASINGEFIIKNKSGQSTPAKLVMRGDSVIRGKLLCADDAVSFEMQDNARIEGDIDVGNSKVSGKVTCTGDITGGIFDKNGTVINNGRIIGGIFYGTVTGTGRIEDSAQVDVVFETAGGSTVDTQKILRGQTAQNPTGCKRDGYTLTGWNRGEEPYDFTAPVVDGFTLTAQWSANRYTVSFDAAGGSLTDDKVLGWNDKVLDGVAEPTRDGWEFKRWKCGNTDVATDTTYADLAVNDSERGITLTAQWKDIEEPTGKIKIGNNGWNKFLNTITFGLFFKETQTVAITASDNSGEPVKIEYLLSDRALTNAELANEAFTEYTDSFNINPDNEYVIYAKLTDKAGNILYICSDGIVLDGTKPVINGIESGKTYCEPQTVEINETHVAAVTVNGKAVTLDGNNSFVLAPADGGQKIVVTDKAGNTAEMTVTVNDGHTALADDGDCTTPVYCGFCNAEAIAAKAHDFTGDRHCDENGHWHECQNENCTVTDPKIAHSGTDDGDCTTAVVCECGYVITAANGAHAWEDWSSNNDGTHTRKCTVDGCTAGVETENCTDIDKDHKCDHCGKKLSDHTGGKATCKNKAVCKICGEAYGEFDAGNHADLVHVPAKAAAKDAAGNIEYWCCAGCDKYYGDAAASREISEADTVTEKLPEELKSPQAGDNGNFMLWIALLIISGAVIGTTAISKKKKRSDK